MKVLITGSGGFCGKHLRKYLTGQKAQTFSIGCNDGNTDHYRINDVTDVAELTSAIKSIAPDYVFHLAGALASKDIHTLYRTNTLYAATLLQALEEAGHGATPVLLAGSSAEYGNVSPGMLPITEETPALPYNHYGASKLAQTTLGMIESDKSRSVVAVRPFNIIGSGMPQELAIPSFIERLKNIKAGLQEPVLEVGDLSPTRDFIDVENAVAIYWKLIQKPEAYGQIINICSGTSIPLENIVTKIIDIASIDVEIKPSSKLFRPVEIQEQVGSPERMREVSGFSGFTGFDTSLKQMLKQAGLI